MLYKDQLVTFCSFLSSALATLKPQAGITAAPGAYAAPAPQPVSVTLCTVVGLGVCRCNIFERKFLRFLFQAFKLVQLTSQHSCCVLVGGGGGGITFLGW